MSKENLVHIADISCNATFKDSSSKYTSSTTLFIGKIKIASFHYDATRPKGQSAKYRVTSLIPTVLIITEFYDTTEECEQICIKIAKRFCEQLVDSSK